MFKRIVLIILLFVMAAAWMYQRYVRHDDVPQLPAQVVILHADEVEAMDEPAHARQATTPLGSARLDSRVSAPPASPAVPATAPVRPMVDVTALDQDRLDMTVLQPLMDRADFTDVLAELRAHSASNPLARDLHQLYSEAIAGVSESSFDGGMRINDMACGPKLCMGVFELEDLSLMGKWVAHMNFNPATRIAVSVLRPFTRPDGSVEHRIVFSNDPEVDSVDHPTR